MPAPVLDHGPDAAESLIYAVSHDLRGPVLNLQGFLRRLRSACEALETQAAGWNLSEEQHRTIEELISSRILSSVDVLDNNSRRLGRLVGALLELSRAGREPVRRERFPASEAAGQAVEAERPAAHRYGATLTMGSLPEVCADRVRLEEIFRRLVCNAVRFLSPDRAGVIRVGGEAQGDQALCFVGDNGIGIRPQDQDRIFFPFSRVREVDAEGEGTGLATVRKLVEQQGGRVWVESVHGQGSVFYFHLPG